MTAPRKPRGRMPLKVTVRVFGVPADYNTTWRPLVERLEKRVIEQRAAQVNP